jgi:hypothetical protein
MPATELVAKTQAVNIGTDGGILVLACKVGRRGV